MEKTRPDLKVNRPRCPYCHDDIVAGDANRACYACLTWHHSECWNYSGCVTCGGGPPEPPSEPKREPSRIDALLDLVKYVNELLADCKNCMDKGYTVQGDRERKERCMWCRKGAEWNRSQTKEHEAIQRGESGPQEEPECNHKFDDKFQCVYCHADAGELHGEDYVDALMDKRGREAYDNEMIVCWSGRCEEPARRADMFCTLCQAESDVFGDPLPYKYAVTKEQREVELTAARRARDRDATIGAVIGLLIVIAFVAAIIYGVFYGA